MKPLATLAVFAVLLFTQCKKEEPLKVTYDVRESSHSQPMYTMTYTSDQSGATTTASSTADFWRSDPIELERGQFVSLKVESTSPQYDLLLRVYVNGFLWEEKEMHNPMSSVTISGNRSE